MTNSTKFYITFMSCLTIAFGCALYGAQKDNNAKDKTITEQTTEIARLNRIHDYRNKIGCKK